MNKLEHMSIVAKNGVRSEYYRLELLDRYGIKKRDLEFVDGNITVNKKSEVKRTGSFTFNGENVSRVTEIQQEPLPSMDTNIKLTSYSGIVWDVWADKNGIIYTVRSNGNSREVVFEGWELKVNDNGILYTERTLKTHTHINYMIDDTGGRHSIGVEPDGKIYTIRQYSSDNNPMDGLNSIKKVYYEVIKERIDIDFLSDRVKAVMGIKLLDGTYKEYDLGVFLFTYAKEKYIKTNLYYQVECMDESVIMQQSTVGEPKLFLRGTPYVEVLQYLIISCGITKIDKSNYSIDTSVNNNSNRLKIATFSSDLVLKSDLVLDGSMNKLRWYNKIAIECGYDDVFVNESGYFVIRKYVEPKAINVSHVYKDDEISVLLPDVDSNIDVWKIPNVFVTILSHPEIGELKSTYINEDPSSKFSTKYRGFEIRETKTIDNVANQEELDAYTRKRAFLANQVTQEISFETLNMPTHSIGDIVELSNDKINGIFVESGWTIELKAGSTMKHSAKRLVILR